MAGIVGQSEVSASKLQFLFCGCAVSEKGGKKYFLKIGAPEIKKIPSTQQLRTKYAI